MVFRKIEFHSNKICDVFMTALCNRRVREWRATLGIPLAVSPRSQFRDRLGSPQPSPSPATSVRQKNGLFFSQEIVDHQ